MVDRKTYRQLIRGLEQHLWFFGQDTLDPENNLFQQYGFYRYRTQGHGGSSRYKASWGFRNLDLHSFCVGIYGNNQNGFIFIREFDQAYLYLGEKPPLPGQYKKEYLKLPSDTVYKQRFYEASCDFLAWLENYESWIDKTHGKSYRLDCYERYHRKWLAPNDARNWFKNYRKLENKKGIFKAA